jgi:hypothetical protein
MLALVERKGMPVHVLGAPEKKSRARREVGIAEAECCLTERFES